MNLHLIAFACFKICLNIKIQFDYPGLLGKLLKSAFYTKKSEGKILKKNKRNYIQALKGWDILELFMVTLYLNRHDTSSLHSYWYINFYCFYLTFLERDFNRMLLL